MPRGRRNRGKRQLSGAVDEQNQAFLHVHGLEESDLKPESHQVFGQSRHGERVFTGSLRSRKQHHPVDRKRHFCRNAGPPVAGLEGKRAGQNIGKNVAEHHAPVPGRFRELRLGSVDRRVRPVREPRRAEHRVQRGTGRGDPGVRPEAPSAERFAHQPHASAGRAGPAPGHSDPARERHNRGEQRRPGRVPAAPHARHQREPYRRGRGRRVRPARPARGAGPERQPAGNGAQKSSGEPAHVEPGEQPDPEPERRRFRRLQTGESVERAEQRHSAHTGLGAGAAVVPRRAGPVREPDPDDHPGDDGGPGAVEGAGAGRAGGAGHPGVPVHRHAVLEPDPLGAQQTLGRDPPGRRSGAVVHDAARVSGPDRLRGEIAAGPYAVLHAQDADADGARTRVRRLRVVVARRLAMRDPRRRRIRRDRPRTAESVRRAQTQELPAPGPLRVARQRRAVCTSRRPGPSRAGRATVCGDGNDDDRRVPDPSDDVCDGTGGGVRAAQRNGGGRERSARPGLRLADRGRTGRLGGDRVRLAVAGPVGVRHRPNWHAAQAVAPVETERGGRGLPEH